jgi:hypothetical protein
MAVHMLDSSADDFFAVKSILGRGVDWNPFAITQMTRLYENYALVLGGKRDIFDGLVNTFSATRENKSMLDYIKQSTLGRAIGDNGDED